MYKIVPKRNRAPAGAFHNPVHFLAIGLGSGAAPYAPGTFGTLAAMVLYLALSRLPPGLYLLFIVAAFVLGIYLCDKTCRDIGVDDHSAVVWDEFVGYWITMVAAPPGWTWMLIGFVLFRAFDVLKPFPIALLDKRVGGGLGVMLDDVLAGTYAWLVLQLLVFVARG